jgi:thiosulfate/3-mercaptopyruvate sulfurtransferase
MKPTPHQFAIAMDLMKVTPNDTLFVYANEGCAAVHRAYWTLRSSGHDPSRVKLVQGSLAEWKSCGGQLDETVLNKEDERLFCMPLDWEKMTPKYTCRGLIDNTVDMEQVVSIVESKEPDTLIVDARSVGRFYGNDPEPRPGLRGGHMPNALNVPFVSLLDDNDLTKFKPLDEIKKKFIEVGIKPYKESGAINKVVCSCGSGVTAAALAVGLEECGLRKKEDIYLYDGSWIEWGSDETTPIRR